jgi:serine/threonine protein kinase
MTDQVIGHYRVLEKIGSGAMGEVFRARDDRLGRAVARKLILPATIVTTCAVSNWKLALQQR